MQLVMNNWCENSTVLLILVLLLGRVALVINTGTGSVVATLLIHFLVKRKHGRLAVPYHRLRVGSPLVERLVISQKRLSLSAP